jgi:hemoglobin-like flavoprotein
MNADLLRSTFNIIKPNAEDVAGRFYAHMFSVYPQVRPLFAKTDFAQQRKKLMASIAAVVTLVDQPDKLLPVLDKMGTSHNTYGVEPQQYAYVSASMLTTFADELGEAWTPEVAETWAQALAFVSEKMIAAQGAAAAA